MTHETRYSSPESWLNALERRLFIPESDLLLEQHGLTRPCFETVARAEAELADGDGCLTSPVASVADRAGTVPDVVHHSRLLLIEIGFLVILEAGSGAPARSGLRLHQPSVLLDADYRDAPPALG